MASFEQAFFLSRLLSEQAFLEQAFSGGGGPAAGGQGQSGRLQHVLPPHGIQAGLIPISLGC